MIFRVKWVRKRNSNISVLNFITSNSRKTTQGPFYFLVLQLLCVIRDLGAMVASLTFASIAQDERGCCRKMGGGGSPPLGRGMMGKGVWELKRQSRQEG